MQIVSLSNTDNKIIESMSCNNDNQDVVSAVVKNNTIKCGFTEEQFTINVMQDADFFAKVQEQNDATPKQPSDIDDVKKQQADLTYTLMMNGVI